MSNTQVRNVRPSRAHDHVYDPIYTVSNKATHYAEANAARMGSVQKVPAYDNMFSDMQRYSLTYIVYTNEYIAFQLFLFLSSLFIPNSFSH